MSKSTPITMTTPELLRLLDNLKDKKVDLDVLPSTQVYELVKKGVACELLERGMERKDLADPNASSHKPPCVSAKAIRNSSR